MRDAKRKCFLRLRWNLSLPRRCRQCGWRSREGRESQGFLPSVRRMQDRPRPKSTRLPIEGSPRLPGVPLCRHIGRRVEVRALPIVGQASVRLDLRRFLGTRWRVGKAGYELLKETESESSSRPILSDSLRQDFLGVVSIYPFSLGAWVWPLTDVTAPSGWLIPQVD